MATAPCRDCGALVSRQAKACPRCGRPVPTQSGWVKVIVAAVLIGPIFLVINRCSTSFVDNMERSGREQRERLDAAAKNQPDRLTFVRKMIARGIFTKVEPGMVPKLYVGGAFWAADFETKQSCADAAFTWCAVECKCNPDGALLRDPMTNKEIGTFSPTFGLRLN